MVEEAIVFQDTQPRRRLLTQWLEQLEVKASLKELKIGSLLEVMSGLALAQVAVILQVIGDGLETVQKLRQQIIEVWYARDKAATKVKNAALRALNSLSFPEASPPATNDSDMGVEPVVFSLNSDIEVGSTGNIYSSPVLPTQGAAYHQVASGRDLETLVLALPWCETVEDFASVIEGFRAEVVEEAIARKPFGFQSELLAWLVGGG
jgi:hypothetical protein